MTTEHSPTALRFGSDDLRLPDELRTAIRAHLATLRERYVERGWAGQVGSAARSEGENESKARR